MKKRFWLLALVIIFTMCFATSCIVYRDVRGKSAYEIAVENGFVGTEQEWLESLKGADGKNAQSPTISEIYQQFLEENPGVSFADFLKEYLKININTGDIETGAIKSAANRALRSAVSIRSSFKRGIKDVTAGGAGVIYKIQGNTAYIITNYHVIYDSSSSPKMSQDIKAYLYGRDGGVYENLEKYAMQATFVGGSMANDIAILRVNSSQISDEFVKTVEVFNSNLIEIGSTAIAVGYPEGSGISVTTGVVSVDSETIELPNLDNSSQTDRVRVMRIDAAVNPGNSGGGLYNAQGKLIGIVNAKIISDNVENIGYAIPSNVATWIADSVIAGNTKKARLGVMVKITEVDLEYDEVNDTARIKETIAIDSVDPGSLAASSGLQVGDILKSVVIAGTEYSIDRLFYLSDLLYKVSVGVNNTFILNIIRNGTPMEITVNATDPVAHFTDL